MQLDCYIYACDDVAEHLLKNAEADVVRYGDLVQKDYVSRDQYDQFRANGWPIGSGVVESAANTVVHHRLKRPGRGWTRECAQAMLAALSELHSHRFEQAWQA